MRSGLTASIMLLGIASPGLAATILGVLAALCVPSAAHAQSPAPTTVPDRVDVTLYMPEHIFLDLHQNARRLDLSDSLLLSACWYASRTKLGSKEGAPKLTASRSRAIYFYLPRELDEEVARTAGGMDRSKSWVLMKAWNLARAQVTRLPDKDAFMIWLQSNKPRPALPRP